MIEQTGAERWRPHVHVERAELYRLTGDTDAAKRELDRGTPAVRGDGCDGTRRAHRDAAGGVGAMNLLDVVREVRRHLEENGRLSLRMLRRQFELDDAALEEVIEELVDVQRVARREENALAWSAATPPVGIPHACTRPALLHSEAPRREDPAIEVRPRRRAQAGDCPLRRREGLDGSFGVDRPRLSQLSSARARLARRMGDEGRYRGELSEAHSPMSGQPGASPPQWLAKRFPC